jgi:hypothetical protein
VGDVVVMAIGVQVNVAASLSIGGIADDGYKPVDVGIVSMVADLAASVLTGGKSGDKDK